MSGLNKFQAIGRLGGDPEIKYMQSGDAVCNISLAMDESYKDKNGAKVDKVEWARVVFFGKVAEIAGEYLRKGGQCYIEGKMRTRKWQNQQGQDVYTTEIVVDSFNGKLILLGGKQDDAGSQSQPQQPAQRQPAPQQSAPQQPPAGFDQFDDDIPF